MQSADFVDHRGLHDEWIMTLLTLWAASMTGCSVSIAWNPKIRPSCLRPCNYTCTSLSARQNNTKRIAKQATFKTIIRYYDHRSYVSVCMTWLYIHDMHVQLIKCVKQRWCSMLCKHIFQCIHTCNTFDNCIKYTRIKTTMYKYSVPSVQCTDYYVHIPHNSLSMLQQYTFAVQYKVNSRGNNIQSGPKK